MPLDTAVTVMRALGEAWCTFCTAVKLTRPRLVPDELLLLPGHYLTLTSIAETHHRWARAVASPEYCYLVRNWKSICQLFWLAAA